MANSPLHRFSLLAAGIFGGTGVGLGALGAHRLEATLAEHGMTRAWETAARYHIVHAVALLGVAALIALPGLSTGAGRLQGAARCWALGILLFSGSLYWFALGGPHPLVYVTPCGGLALLAGWVFVIAAAFARRD